eukprot:scaffold87254_cov72-Phaeocystis_antarctica.AAC.2
MNAWPRCAPLARAHRVEHELTRDRAAPLSVSQSVLEVFRKVCSGALISLAQEIISAAGGSGARAHHLQQDLERPLQADREEGPEGGRCAARTDSDGNEFHELEQNQHGSLARAHGTHQNPV